MKTTMIKRTMATIMATAMAFTGTAFSPTIAEAAVFSGTTRIQTNTAVQGSINKGHVYGSNTYEFSIDNPGGVTVGFETPRQKDKNRYWKLKLYTSDYT